MSQNPPTFDLQLGSRDLVEGMLRVATVLTQNPSAKTQADPVCSNSDDLRSFVLRHVSDSARTSIHHARDLVSHTLKYIPNPANQSVDEIWKEIQQAIESCDWFLVYDLIEELYRDRQWSKDEQDGFLKEVNEFFYDQHLGWQLRTAPIEGTNLAAPEIVIRGSEAFEMTVTGTLHSLESSGRSTAKKELHGALQDHAGRTLGQTVKRHPDRFPAQLGDAVGKLRGFACDGARHVTESKVPLQKKAELVASTAAGSSLSGRDLQIHNAVGRERFRTLTNAEIMKEVSVKKCLRFDFGLEPGDAAKCCLDRIRRAKGYPLSREIAKKRSTRK
jgi:hypothetical protein